MEELAGTVAKIVFRAADGSYAVARLSRPQGTETIVGDLVGIDEGDEVRVSGEFSDHPRFGRQFRVASLVPVIPTTRDGVERYLASGRIPGIGKKLAERIVADLGANALEAIRADPQVLRQIDGIGEKRAHEIAAAVAERAELEETLIFLQGLKLGPGFATRIAAAFGADAIRKIRANPYCLAEQVKGIGFRIADRIARELGTSPDSVERAEAALTFLLVEASAQGHCYLPVPELLGQTSELLAMDATELFEVALQRRIEQGKIAVDTIPGPAFDHREGPSGQGAYLRRLHLCELGVTGMLRQLLAAPRGRPIVPRSGFQRLARGLGIQLDPGQEAALEMLASEPVAILTGGPGVGKTTILRLLVGAARERRISIALAAPTGRAARRLSESTGHEAKTIHRLLGFEPHSGRFRAGPAEPLEEDLIILDEVSMMDLPLTYALLRAIRVGARLVLVGDSDQLPSVGPGSVLRDLVGSNRIPTARLTRIFRQAERSHIVRAAHALLEGRMPRFPRGGEESDFYFLQCEGGLAIQKTVLDLVRRRLPAHYGLDPMDDIQVLSPMYRGPAGVDELNRGLREALNPEGRSLARGERLFRLGDKIIQLRNDYDREVFNGDVGRVIEVAPEARRMVVTFEDRPVEYGEAQLEDLAPAYAITVHRAQGSEYPVVIMVLSSDHFIMLKRNLVYTALTRGRRLVVLVGSMQALRRAVQTVESRGRYSALRERLLFAEEMHLKDDVPDQA